MRSAWLIVALAPAFSGCFGSHGMPGGGGDEDAGPGPGDAGGGGGMCLELEGAVQELRCPMGAVEGEPVSVALTTYPSRCCSSGTPRAAVLGGIGSYQIQVDWTACDCCTGCRCVGPIEEIVVDLGPAMAGTHTVRAGGMECSFTVGPPAECGAITADDTRMPRVIYTDQQLAVTLTARGAGGCGCEPRVSDGGGTLDFRLQICNCCDECDCIDAGYQASRRVGPLMSGEYSVVIPHGVATVAVREPGSCGRGTATGVRVVGPDDSLTVGGPRLWWALVSGSEWLCCAAPMPAVEQGTGPMGEIVLSLDSCVEVDCDCEPRAPTPVDAWHSLGELGPGTYTVVAGTARTTFTVP